MDTTLHKVKDMHADEKCPNHKIRLSFSLRIGGKWTTPLHFQDRQWAITLPRCSADRGEMKAWIIEKFGPIDGGVTTLHMDELKFAITWVDPSDTSRVDGKKR